MTWFWTDDLARVLLARGLTNERSVQDWLMRPVAVAGPNDADPVAMAQGLLDSEDVPPLSGRLFAVRAA
jgi:hypothetical protein